MAGSAHRYCLPTKLSAVPAQLGELPRPNSALNPAKYRGLKNRGF